MNIVGGSNVTVDVSEHDITISATDSQYELEALNNNGKAIVRLTGNEDAGGTNSDVEFKAGNNLVVSADNTGITYAHETIETTNSSDTTATVLTHGGVVDVITEIATDNGHVTQVTTKKYQLPSDIHVEDIEKGADGEWKATLKQTGGINKTIDFSADADILEERLTDLIDEKMAAANTALTYKGTISSYNDLLTKTGVEVGDVYLLNNKDGTYEIGDMFIATVGSDDDHTGGVIDSDKVIWTYVPSGDELNTDTLFYGDVTVESGTGTGGSVTYTLNATRGADDSGVPEAVPNDNEDLVIKGGTDILITGSGSEATINHKTYDNVTPQNSSASSSESFTAITSVSVENGHVTGINTQTFTLDTYELAGTDNKIQLKKGTGVVDSIEVTGDSWITATVSDDKLALSHADAQGANTTVNVTNETLNHDGTLNIITGVAYDSKGHISEVTTGSVQLPSDNNTTYDMFVGNATNSDSSVSSATEDPYLVLRDSDGVNDTVQLKGDSGSLIVTGTSGVVTIGMFWDSF